MDRRSEIEDRLADRRRTLDRIVGRADGIVRLRLILFAALIAAVWLSLVANRIGAWILLVPGALFILLLVLHARNRSAEKRARRAVRFHEDALARMSGEWTGRGATGERFLEPQHPCAGDLDLFGPASLFERISTARTAAGEETLAEWLLEPADAPEIVARQQAVAELGERLDFREELALQGEESRRGVESSALRKWAASPPVAFSSAERALAIVAGIVAIAALALAIPSWILALSAPAGSPRGADLGWLLLLSALVSFLTWLRLRSRVDRVLAGVEDAGLDLEILGAMLALIARSEFRSERLTRLTAGMSVEGRSASEQIAQLERLVVLLDSRRNQMFMPVAGLLLWSSHFAMAIERWRARSGQAVVRWVETVGAVESLASLGAFWFEEPQSVFPTIASGETLFEATGLGHPLIAREQLVRNDVTLDSGTSLLLVSGSNMSGKSTLLRSIGVAATLAFAGGPVTAESLRISPLRVGASIRLHDSLHEGASRFWAEITRLRQLLDLARKGDLPLLFLLDEVLAGTNSHDRRIGAEAVLDSLLATGAIGLVTTHDLALAEIAASHGGKVRNVHFEDRLDGGNVVFDYRMRDGVVTRSNALALMKMVGLVE